MNRLDCRCVAACLICAKQVANATFIPVFTFQLVWKLTRISENPVSRAAAFLVPCAGIGFAAFDRPLANASCRRNALKYDLDGTN